MSHPASRDVAVSVVVPYYERPDQLARLVAGLAVQTLTPETFELVVADDGSREPPVVGPAPFAVTVVGQPDDGFRLGAARNLGARSARGRVVAFLDQDCVPAPDYLERVLAASAGEWDLVLGHRRHVDLQGWSPAATRAWLTGAGPAPTELDEPRWLLDAYARTDNLTRPDPRSYQLVIGAVTNVSAPLLQRIGGYDESFRAYGGEDWEFGHRALVAGADTQWLPDAVVWHDGPDLPGRGDWVGVKNAETLTLARRVPDRDVRGTGLVWRQPDTVVRLDAGGCAGPAVVAAVASLLRGSDAHVWLRLQDLDLDDLQLEDPRVHEGAVPDAVLARARWLVDCTPVLLHGATLGELTAHAPLTVPGLRLRSTRDENRRARGVQGAPVAAPRGLPHGIRIEPVVDPPVLERLWQSGG